MAQQRHVAEHAGDAWGELALVHECLQVGVAEQVAQLIFNVAVS